MEIHSTNIFFKLNSTDLMMTLMNQSCLVLSCSSCFCSISLLLLFFYVGLDYSFHLDGSEGVCDLFDVQILNY